MQEDLILNAKVSYAKVNKVRGHLLSQYVVLEIGLFPTLPIVCKEFLLLKEDL